MTADRACVTFPEGGSDWEGSAVRNRVLAWVGGSLAVGAAVVVLTHSASNRSIEAVPNGEPKATVVIGHEVAGFDQKAFDEAKTLEDLKKVKGLVLGGPDNDSKPAPSEPPR